jgi:tyrosine-protein kinase
LTSSTSRASWRGWFWFVLVGTLFGTSIAAAVAVVTPPTYTAHVTLLVAPAKSDTPITNDDLNLAQAYIPTLAEFATIRPLLEKVISTTGVTIDVERLADDVTTRSPVGTSLLTINVANPVPADAAKLANAIASELQTYASPTGETAGAMELSVVDPAQPPTGRDGPGLAIRIGLGGVIALFLAISIAFLVENVGRGAQNLGGRGRKVDDMGTPLGRGSEPYSG